MEIEYGKKIEYDQKKMFKKRRKKDSFNAPSKWGWRKVEK